MMPIKVVLQLLLFALVFTLFTTRQTQGEKDCYRQKLVIKFKCWETIKLGVPCVAPSQECIRLIRRSDMVCICCAIAEEDEEEISVAKLLQLADECNKSVPLGTKCGSITYFIHILLV
ncbi:hypothetical protein HU200_014841 [Digitaria exilis]|uniref:Bifunctional inhibitor/plant lipid transfer protein/seed storage helical domain-containing protein n=1 Tax=Digitaria exilis TaxID=1010633 RepID=A0A835FBG4_9POAL|nr:hypothetical protein HU200_014841 [Digitaria exilis]